MGVMVLAVSTILQIATVIVAVAIFWSSMRRAWAIVACAIFLMAVRRSFTLYQAIVADRSPDPVAESVALVISILMLIGMTIISLHSRSADNKGAIVAPAWFSNPVIGAAGIWTLILVASVVLSYYSYTISRNALIERIFAENLLTIQTIADRIELADESENRTALLASVEEFWARSSHSFPGTYICGIDESGNLNLHTGRPETLGEFAGATPIADPEGEYSSIAELFEAKTSWVGWYTSRGGERQVAAFTYSPALNSVLAIHVPEIEVEKAVLRTLLPVGLTTLVIVAILLPIAMIIMYRAYTFVITRLEASEQRFRTVVNEQEDLICRCLPDTTITFVNDAYCQVFGKTREELLGTKFVQLVPNEDRPKISSAFTGFTPEAPSKTFDNRSIDKDGQIRWHQWRARATFDDAGRVIEVQGTGREITHEHELEEQLLQSQKLEALGNLAGGIAHDFNNILQIINGYADMGLEQTKNEDCEGAIDSLQGILDNSQRAGDLASQILAFGRIKDVDLEPLRIAPIIEDVAKFLRRSMTSVINIESRIDDSTSIVLGNTTQIHQLITNLGVNAMHAMENKPGTMTIALESYETRSDLTTMTGALSPGAYLKLIVSDTGIGIPPGDMDRLLEPFFTTKEAGKGTGLGLSVVRRIVQLMGGQIQIESELGEGTVVSVYLPVVGETVEIAALELDSSTEALRGLAPIMVVDDEVTIATLVRRLLEREGLVVETFNSVESAEECARMTGRTYSVALIDFAMPRKNGVELAQSLFELHPGMPVIILTGNVNEVREQANCPANITDVIQKPVSRSHLIRSINSAIMPPVESGRLR